MLSLNIIPILKARGIERPYSFLVKAGLSPHTAHTILNSYTRVFRLDHIELLCRVLTCEPNDLLEFTPDPLHPLQQDHPLHILTSKGDKSLENIKEALSNMPLKQLREIGKHLNEELKTDHKEH